MSQYGAIGYAQHGVGYAAILGHYYTGTALATVGELRRARAAAERPRASLTVAGLDRVGTAAARPGQDLHGRRRGGKGGRCVKQRAPQAGRDAAAAPRWPAGARRCCAGQRPTACAAAATAARSRSAARGGGVMAINALGLEDYVRGVVAAESPSTWPAEALQGAGRGRAHLRDHDGQRRRATTASTSTPTRARRCTGASAPRRRRPTPPSPRPAARSSTYAGRAGRDLLLLDLGRAHRERRELVPRLAAASRGSRASTTPTTTSRPRHTWGPFTLTAAQAAVAAARAPAGAVQGDQGDAARGLPARRVGDARRHAREHRRSAARRCGAASASTTRGPTSRRSARASASRRRRPRPTPATGGSGTAAWRRPRLGSLRRHVARRGQRRRGAPARRRRRPRTAPSQPGRRGAWVRLQRREGARWVLAADVRLGRGGRYAVTAPQPGTYRVLAGRAAGPSVRVG